MLHNFVASATLLRIEYTFRMPQATTEPVLFGDLLALARRGWVSEMARRLENKGFHDYRRSDAATLRWLQHGSRPLSDLATTLGVTRQGGRKVVDGLVARGFALMDRDAQDARRVNVSLTTAGHEYAAAVVDVVRALNQELDTRLDPYDLVIVKSVLRSVSSIYASD
jgi:DNA-binding MarR family transcriptional regulator